LHRLRNTSGNEISIIRVAAILPLRLASDITTGNHLVRLPDFILENIEPILVDWEAFARSIWPGAERDILELRDHAERILLAAVNDMKSAQTAQQESDKSQGKAGSSSESADLNGASVEHALARVTSGFNLLAMVSEYRALRGTVVRLWRDSGPQPDLHDLDDLTRFNESIDQSLTKAIESFTARVDRARHMFLAVLGHDLRNPLNAITMAARLLTHTAPADSETSVLSSGIDSSAHAMTEMITKLLDFTAAGLGGAMPISPAPLDLATLCQQVVEECRIAFPGRKIDLQLQGDLTGQWDPARLRQVLSNLLSNALDHGSRDDPVRLAAAIHGPDVQMTFHNSGAPIEPADLARIFQPLVRGQSPRQRRPGSLGLGLYIAREIVTTHGGTIDVTSSADSGTLFTVRLPRHLPPRSAA
jgi:signal transduction histidine kinase